MKHSLESSQHNTNENGKLDNTARDGSASDQQPQIIFGIQWRATEVGMTELLRCILSKLKEERDYPDLSGKQRRKGRVPPSRATRSSMSVAACREPPSEEEMAKKKSVEEFKLRKFMS